jgi:hypothetical protein
MRVSNGSLQAGDPVGSHHHDVKIESPEQAADSSVDSLRANVVVHLAMFSEYHFLSAKLVSNVYPVFKGV